MKPGNAASVRERERRAIRAQQERRAAKDLDRKAVGFEIRADYCATAASRLRQEVLDLAV